MDTHIDFKKIWNKQETNAPKVEDLYKKLDTLKRTQLLKLIIVNFTLLITIVLVGFIWFYYQPDYLSTKIGIVLTILAMIIFLVPYNRQWSLLTKSSTESSSKESLLNLIRLKEKQLFQQTTMLSIYFVMLSLGIVLYLFEYVSKMSITLGVTVYVAMILWIAVNWFYLRPKIIKKQQEKTNRLISRLQNLCKQLDD